MKPYERLYRTWQVGKVDFFVYSHHPAFRLRENLRLNYIETESVKGSTSVRRTSIEQVSCKCFEDIKWFWTGDKNVNIDYSISKRQLSILTAVDKEEEAADITWHVSIHEFISSNKPRTQLNK